MHSQVKQDNPSKGVQLRERLEFGALNEQALELRLLKKSMIADGDGEE